MHSCLVTSEPEESSFSPGGDGTASIRVTGGKQMGTFRWEEGGRPGVLQASEETSGRGLPAPVPLWVPRATSQRPSCCQILSSIFRHFT